MCQSGCVYNNFGITARLHAGTIVRVHPATRVFAPHLLYRPCCNADWPERQSSGGCGPVECCFGYDPCIPSVVGALLDTCDTCTRGSTRERRCGAVVLASTGKMILSCDVPLATLLVIFCCLLQRQSCMVDSFTGQHRWQPGDPL